MSSSVIPNCSATFLIGIISDTVNYIKEHSGEAEYDDTIDAKLTTDQEAMANGGEVDPYFAQAGRLCIEKQKGSTSMIQRQFKVGFNRAARIMEQLPVRFQYQSSSFFLSFTTSFLLTDHR